MQLRKLDGHRHATSNNYVEGQIKTLNQLINAGRMDLVDIWMKTKFHMFNHQILGLMLNRNKQLNHPASELHLLELPSQLPKLLQLLTDLDYLHPYMLSEVNSNQALNLGQLAQNYKTTNKNVSKHMRLLNYTGKAIVQAADLLAQHKGIEHLDLTLQELDYTQYDISNKQATDVGPDMNHITLTPSKPFKVQKAKANNKPKPQPKAKQTSQRFLELIGSGPSKTKTPANNTPNQTLTGVKLLEQTKTQANKSMSNDKSRKANGSGWRKVRYQALTLLGNSCACCGLQPGDLHDDGSRVIATGDHVQPFCLNPKLRTELLNIQILCDQCNVAKGHKDTTDWRTIEQLDKLIKARFLITPETPLETLVILHCWVYEKTQRQVALELQQSQSRISRVNMKLKAML